MEQIASAWQTVAPYIGPIVYLAIVVIIARAIWLTFANTKGASISTKRRVLLDYIMLRNPKTSTAVVG